MAQKPLLYDPTQWEITFKGQPLVGFANGTKLKATFNSDATTMVIGGDGNPTVVVGVDKSGKIELSLQRGSASNEYLSTAHASLRAGNPQAAIGEFFAKHLGDGTTIKGTTSVIVKHADAEVSNELVNDTWSFNVGELTIKNKLGVQL